VELIEALPSAWDPLEELNVQLQAMPGLWLLVSLPDSSMRLTLLVTRQDAVHGGACNGQMVKAPQIIGDPAGPKVVALPKVKDLGDDLGGRSSGGPERYAGAIA
jgi:hypothetical protein